VPIQNFSAGGSWETSRQGFVPSVNHQIHCLVSYLLGSRHSVKSLTFTGNDQALFHRRRERPRDDSRGLWACKSLRRVPSPCKIISSLLPLPLYELTQGKAIMCTGDLTLEKPDAPTKYHLESIAYDETVHLCRDWTALSDALHGMSLGFDFSGPAITTFDNSGSRPRQAVFPFKEAV